MLSGTVTSDVVREVESGSCVSGKWHRSLIYDSCGHINMAIYKADGFDYISFILESVHVFYVTTYPLLEEIDVD